MIPALQFSGRRALGLFDRLVADIPEDRFTRMAKSSEGPVLANHPAFIAGHLALYPQRVFGMLSLDPSPAAVPESWVGLMEKDQPCQDDPQGTIYPSRDTLIDAYRRTYGSLIEALGSADPAVFDQPVSDESYRKMADTNGEVICFMLTSHNMFHLGQLSTWRRIEGLGSAV